MAESVYSGLQGHGKSYEVVRSVIVPNVAKGRRVVTNVAGLNVDKIRAYCVDKLGADPEKLGEIVNVTNERIVEPKFFPIENADNTDCVVQGGDVIIIDECWRYYVTGEKLPDGHLTFFRMHRHFLHPETGQCCDLVLIVQDIDDLQRKVRATVEKSFLMKKHKELGMDNRYSVTAFSGKRQTHAAITEQFQESYKPEIFELYSSYSQSGGAAKASEAAADKRGNVLNRKLFKFGIPLAILAIGGGIWNTWRFFHPDLKPVTTPKTEAGQGAEGPASGQAAPPKKPAGPETSGTWRLVGTVMRGGLVQFMLVDASSRVRYVENPPGFKVGANEIEVALPGGEVVTHWTGPAPVAISSASMLPGGRR